MKDIVKRLIQIGAIKKGKYILSSGKESNIYIDLRLVLSYPDLYEKIVEECAQILKNIGFDAIAGIPTGGLAWASFLAYRLRKPLIYVRKESKGHGAQKLIEGQLKENSSVIIVDDVATTGGNIFDAYEKLQSQNYFAKYAFVIVDREEGAREKLSEKGIELLSLLKMINITSLLNS